MRIDIKTETLSFSVTVPTMLRGAPVVPIIDVEKGNIISMVIARGIEDDWDSEAEKWFQSIIDNAPLTA